MEYHNSPNLSFDGAIQGDAPLIEHRPRPNEPICVEFYHHQPFGVDRMIPEAIVALNCQLEENVAREHKEKEEEVLEGLVTAADRRYEDFLKELAVLPSHNPGKAKEVYTALANSEDSKPRETVSLIIQELARVDTNDALPLWEQLLSDQDGAVRYTAYDTLVCSTAQDYFGMGDELTLAQVAPLFMAYMHAEWRAR